MLQYIIRRILLMIPVVICVPIIVFFVIQLPPGDYVTHYAAQMSVQGENMTQLEMDEMRASLNLDRHWFIQYLLWMKGILFHFDFGHSFNYNEPVTTVIERYMGLTLIVSLTTLAFTFLLAIPIGIYTAVK